VKPGARPGVFGLTPDEPVLYIARSRAG